MTAKLSPDLSGGEVLADRAEFGAVVDQTPLQRQVGTGPSEGGR